MSIPRLSGERMCLAGRTPSGEPPVPGWHSDYLDAVALTVESRNWFEALSQHLPPIIRSTSPGLLEEYTRIGIIQSIPTLLRILQVGDLEIPVGIETGPKSVFELGHGTIRSDSTPFVQYITGGGLPVPHFQFKASNDYLKFLRAIRYPDRPLGITIPIDFNEFMSHFSTTGSEGDPTQLDITPWEPREMRPLSIIAWDADLQTTNQELLNKTMRHEITHAIDPLSWARRAYSDGILLTELVAMIGMHATPGQDDQPVTISPKDWESYAEKIRGWTDGLILASGLTPSRSGNLSVKEIALGMAKLTTDLSSQHKNSDLTRKLMGCVSFEDVYRKLFMPQLVEVL